jgi:hypothetical protein
VLAVIAHHSYLFGVDALEANLVIRAVVVVIVATNHSTTRPGPESAWPVSFVMDAVAVVVVVCLNAVVRAVCP